MPRRPRTISATSTRLMIWLGLPIALFTLVTQEARVQAVIGRWLGRRERRSGRR